MNSTQQTQPIQQEYYQIDKNVYHSDAFKCFVHELRDINTRGQRVLVEFEEDGWIVDMPRRHIVMGLGINATGKRMVVEFEDGRLVDMNVSALLRK